MRTRQRTTATTSRYSAGIATVGPGPRSCAATKRDFVFRYRSAQHFLEVFRSYYGPMLKTFGALPPAGPGSGSGIR
jgi:hypothetical protein